MNEVIDQLLGHIKGIWRYRWYIHAVAWPICIGGWIAIHYLPDQYEASARVYVDTRSMLKPLLRGLAVESDIASDILMITNTLLSRPNLEKVARMTDFDLDAKTPGELDELIDRLQKTIVLTGQLHDNIYTITYVDRDPQKAKKLVQALLTLFVESSLGDSRKDSNVAQKFIDKQIEEYERKLSEAEERLKEFKQRNVSVMSSTQGNYFDRLQNDKANLMSAELQLREAEKRIEELKKQIEGEEPVFGIVPSASAARAAVSHPLDARIAKLEERLDTLLLTFTKEHPDVKGAMDTIAKLKAERDADIKPQAAMSNNRSNSVDQNPVYQQLKIGLGNAESEAAALRVRVAEFKTRVARLASMLDTVPEVEAELVRLNRDYDVNKQNYELLLGRRQSAKLSEEADESSDDLKFKVVDPPRVPLEPTGPNRLLFMTVVLVGGLVGGIAFAFLLSQVKPTFGSLRALRKSTGLPVFGSVSMVWTDRQTRMHRIEVFSFIMIALVLVSVYGTVIAAQLLWS